LIPLKARAWLDLVARKAREPDAVDSRQIRKHCNDVLRLSQLLSEADRIELPDAIREDVDRFCQDVAPEVTTDLLAQLGVQESPDALLAQLRKNFGG
jgi:hypothetical protein